ncbi:MAG: murein biosynthesis integral membrane protein MurJ [Syntrophorhabdaceae bacterium]|nr:murein biosynthesis integral membrane protein MurJ [Syntrophorhabdaceae bacterium]
MPDSDATKKIGYAAAIMMASVFLSRILGYARDAVIAYQHGATPATDAYFAAFTIPDFLNYLLAGGSLSITFIPIFSRYIAEGREEEGFRAFSTIATVMGSAMLIFIVLGELFAEKIIVVIAPGFSPEQVAMASHLTRIIMPAQFFFYLGGLLMAIQYARKEFFLPALAPLIYNAGIIIGGLLGGRRHGMAGFAWGVVAGAFLGNFILQLYGARRGGLVFRPLFDLSSPALREFIKLSIPIMIGFSLIVVDEWALRWFGSFLVAGSITWLNNARRLMMVPVGIFGQASGVASYPFLTELMAKGMKKEMWETLSSTLRWVFFVSAAVGAMAFALAPESIFLVYKRGAFQIEDAVATASAFSAFAIGIPFWCSQAIVSRGFFAMKDTWTPTIVGTASMVVALPVYYILHQTHGVFGLALATTTGMLLNAAALYIILMRRTIGMESLAHLSEYGKIALSAVLAAVVGTYALQATGQFIPWDTFVGALARCAAGAAFIGVIYFLAAFLLGCRVVRGIRGLKDLVRPPSRKPNSGETGTN